MNFYMGFGVMDSMVKGGNKDNSFVTEFILIDKPLSLDKAHR
jgi:hypothetical protein